jgi:hypothetical protein
MVHYCTDCALAYEGRCCLKNRTVRTESRACLVYHERTPEMAKTVSELVVNITPRFASGGIIWLPLTRGDRVRIKEGYDGAGQVYYYGAKSSEMSNSVTVYMLPSDMEKMGHGIHLLADAIEPYPYTREERIERAIEDFEFQLADEFPMAAHTMVQSSTCRALLFAILDAGV